MGCWLQIPLKAPATKHRAQSGQTNQALQDFDGSGNLKNPGFHVGLTPGNILSRPDRVNPWNQPLLSMRLSGIGGSMVIPGLRNPVVKARNAYAMPHQIAL